MQNTTDNNWHHLPHSEVLDLLQADLNQGLSAAEVSRRQQQYGRNVLTQKTGQHPLVLFLLQFNQPLVYILLGATLITAALQEWVDSGVIFGVVLVNAVIGFVQESKAVKAMEALARGMDSSATVRRNGQKQIVSSNELVPGDVVLLQSGDKVPPIFVCSIVASYRSTSLR